ncbi:hypothetical protein A0H81_13839 [Grifola frondosa]|uniref:Secreted protein n=1 Tax=Grifola frondosa TaxID=5627 RepID=A0A1C7LNE7_GRIFR|nr:hypothetical protein A0H81_13839 [Grifola frondosa]
MFTCRANSSAGLIFLLRFVNTLWCPLSCDKSNQEKHSIPLTCHRNDLEVHFLAKGTTLLKEQRVYRHANF